MKTLFMEHFSHRIVTQSALQIKIMARNRTSAGTARVQNVHAVLKYMKDQDHEETYKL